MSDDLDRELQLMEYERNATLEALGNTLQTISSRIDSLFTLIGDMKADIRTIMERTAPKSSCIFCSVTDNVDGHYTARCHRYPTP